jgi:hypothetical protein
VEVPTTRPNAEGKSQHGVSILTDVPVIDVLLI